MIKNTTNDFAAYLQVDIAKQLAPIEDSIDNMLTRLEEFESMVALVQQERGNAVGLTGSLSQVADCKLELHTLCTKVDVLENLVINVRESLDSLEEQVQTAEEQYGYAENNTLKNFFIPKMFKKTPETKQNCSRESVAVFKTSDYFVPSDQEQS